MTTKERLALMEEIKQKNDEAWSKYTHKPTPGWTWEQPNKQRFRPFETTGEKCILTGCGALMLVLFVLMA